MDNHLLQTTYYNRRPKDTNATTKRKPVCRDRHIRCRLQMKKELNYLEKYQEK